LREAACSYAENGEQNEELKTIWAHESSDDAYTTVAIKWSRAAA